MVHRDPRCRECGEREWSARDVSQAQRESLDERYPHQRGWRKLVCNNCENTQFESTRRLV